MSKQDESCDTELQIEHLKLDTDDSKGLHWTQ